MRSILITKILAGLYVLLFPIKVYLGKKILVLICITWILTYKNHLRNIVLLFKELAFQSILALSAVLTLSLF